MSGLSARAAAAAGLVAGHWRSASRGNRVNVGLEFPGLADALDRLVEALAQPAEPAARGEMETVVTVQVRPSGPAAPVEPAERVEPARPVVRAEGRKRRPVDDHADQADEVDAGTAARRVLSAARGAEWIAESVWGPDGPRALSGKLLAGLCRRARRMADNADREADEAAHRVQVTAAGDGVEVPARDFLELDEVEEVAWGIGALAAGEVAQRFHPDAFELGVDG